MPSRLFLLALSVALFSTSCTQQAPQEPGLGEAFVGPIQINVRQDLPPSSPTIVTLNHGDRVELMQARRRFIKIRTAAGKEGWVDGRSLISTAQMNELRMMSEANRNTPSQGRAKAFEPLNMHGEPSRVSPSFSQIAEGAYVDVLDQRSTPRSTGADTAPILPVAKPAPRVRHPKKGAKEKAPPLLALPPPPTPKLPENWRELSRTRLREDEEDKEERLLKEADTKSGRSGKKGQEEQVVHLDDWSLVRSKEGRVGWVLTRMIQMGIPDDVAQYAEGKRITSYFSLGEVVDEDRKKNNWLWTVLSKGGLPYQYDAFRLFWWNPRHHRYETAYRESNLIGYYPTQVKTMVETIGKTQETVPVFSVLLQSGNGCTRKTFAFESNRARLISKDPAACPTQQSPTESKPPAPLLPAAQEAPPPQPQPKNVFTRIKDSWNSWRGRK